MGEGRQVKSRLASRGLAVFRFVLSHVLGVGITIGVFLMLPLLQAIIEATKPEKGGPSRYRITCEPEQAAS